MKDLVATVVAAGHAELQPAVREDRTVTVGRLAVIAPGTGRHHPVDPIAFFQRIQIAEKKIFGFLAHQGNHQK